MSLQGITWNSAGWWGRSFTFKQAENHLADMKVDSWRSSAEYTSTRQQLSFKQSGFWKTTIAVSSAGQPIASITSSYSGRHTITFNDGRTFQLMSNFWGRKLRWEDSQGVTVVSYHEKSVWMSMESGMVELSPALDDGTAEVLMVAAIYLTQITNYIVFIVLLIVIIAGAN